MDFKKIRCIIKRALKDHRVDSFNRDHYNFIETDDMYINFKGLNGRLHIDYHSINIDNYKIIIFSN